MGRITVFGSLDCPHCTRAKGALKNLGIPFVDIDVDRHPERRADMMILTDRFSIPQIFWNEQHVGGADELVAKLEEWDSQEARTVVQTDATSAGSILEVPPFNASALDRYQMEVASQPDPQNPRLRLPPSDSDGDKMHPLMSPRPNPVHDEVLIPLPDGNSLKPMEVMLLLDDILDSKDRLYKAHKYKNSFVNHDGVLDVRNYFGCTREDAVDFLRRLQKDHGMLYHVCDDHDFGDDNTHLFFRLQCFHQPDVLNSFRMWKEESEQESSLIVADAPAIVSRLKSMLGSIIRQHTDSATGLVDYIAARKDPKYPLFEDAVCELQVVDMALMDETSRKAFALNVYNLMITYAFIKMGIAASSLTRGAFYSHVKMNIGGSILSFDDLENGVLRANTRHPYASKPPFGPDDPRRSALPLSNLDPRIHFALNCGAKSCPPVKFFHAESLEEELRIVALSFCETEDAIHLDESKHEMKVTMLLKWFQADFGITHKDQLPQRLLDFLKGSKRQTLQRMLSVQDCITVKYHPYDWSTNASRCETYAKQHGKANTLSAEAMLHFQGYFPNWTSASSSSTTSAPTTTMTTAVAADLDTRSSQSF